MSAHPDTVVTAAELYRFFRVGDEEILALRGVSLAAERGEMVAVAGPSGSGKTTLLACLAGLDEPDGGVVRLCGEVLSHRPELERARIRAAHIGMVFQQDNLFDHLTVEQNVRLIRQLTPTPAHDTVSEILDRLGLDTLADARPSHLSGGEGARAGLAVALAGNPDLIIADEPTGELDTASEARLLEVLRARCRDGTAVIVASHSPVVAGRADRVVELADGQMR